MVHTKKKVINALLDDDTCVIEVRKEKPDTTPDVQLRDMMLYIISAHC